MIPASITAGDLSNLQQQTNQAYEQMKQAESQLSSARKDVQVKQDNLRYHQEKAAETEKELQAAQQVLQSAEENLSAARKNGMRIPKSFIRSGTGKNEVMQPKLPDITVPARVPYLSERMVKNDRFCSIRTG